MRREPVGEDRVDDPRVLAHSSVLAQISVNNFVYFIYSLVEMLCKLDSLPCCHFFLQILNLKLFCKSLNVIFSIL